MGVLYAKILELLDLHCPYKEGWVKSDRPGYITSEIIDICHLRDKLFKIARKSRLEADWIRPRAQRQIANYAVRKGQVFS